MKPWHWFLVGIFRRAARRLHVKFHRQLCYFGVHSPVGTTISLSAGEYKILKPLSVGAVTIAGHDLLQVGRYCFMPGADPTGQRDCTDVLQAAMNVAAADKRRWCEFCDKLLSKGD